MTNAPSALEPTVGQTRAGDRFLFVACFIALVATSFSFIIRVMLMGEWQVAFALSETQKGEIFGAGLWPFGLSIVVFSLVIDRVGYGKSMVFAFACHLVSTVLLTSANGYWMLYAGSILNGLAAGTVEAVINPVVATMYPKNKTKMLTILHAGWPGGFVLAGVAILLMDLAGGVEWGLKVGIILIPVAAYGAMLLKCTFPPNERVAAGIPYKDMLKEAGAIGWLLVVYLVLMEVNRVAGMGNMLETAIVNLPSLPMTILMVVLVGGYLLYTKTLGRFMYIFLLVIMILLAITELGTDTWIKELMGPAMSKIGLDAGWVLVYTATIMTILRFCIGPIVKVLKPLGVLLVSSLCAAAGLYLLSSAQGGSILLWATVYGTGKCFFWPVTLGLVSERFPRGGALTLNAMGGVGMLGVGILGSQLLGYWQDTRIDQSLQDKGGAYVKLIDPTTKKSVLGRYKSLDQGRMNAINDKCGLYEHKRDLAKDLKGPDAAALALKLADDKQYQTLVRNAVEHMTPVKPAEGETVALAAYEVQMAAHEKASQSYEGQLAYLAANGILLSADEYQAVKKKQDTVNAVTADAKQNAMARVAILPLIMAACYIGLIIYFKTKGGYKAIDLMSEGKPAGEHTPTVEEEVADAEATPSE